MTMLLNYWPVIGQILLLAVLSTLLTDILIKNFKQRKVVVALMVGLSMFIPVYGLSLAQWLRSALGDLSIFSLLILLNILAQRLFNRSLLCSSSKNILLVAVVVVGVIFYPLALGVSDFDPYRLGYSPVYLSVILCLASVFAWTKMMRDLAIVLLLPVLAYNLHLLESANLWDYLLDPVLLIYAAVQWLKNGRFMRFKTVVKT